MKKTLHKKATSPVAKLSAVALTCLGLLPEAEAAVTWLASDFDGGLLVTTSGSLELDEGSVTGTDTALSPQGWIEHDTLPGQFLIGVMFDHGPLEDILLAEGTMGPFAFGTPGVAQTFDVSGSTFWVDGGAYYTAGTLAFNPDDYDGMFVTPNSRMFFPGISVASVFGTSLDSGPQVLWTNHLEEGTIYVESANMSSVPEPSGVLSLGAILGLGLMFRTRR